MTVELPEPEWPATCWPFDFSCCPDWDSYSPVIQGHAEALAGMTMRMLTGYQVGGCPVTVRPCLSRCMEGTWQQAIVPPGSGVFSPYINANGAWVNGCGCVRDCSCTSLCEVRLPPPVGWVGQVTIDGAVLDSSAYRVDNDSLLVRTDGECWPTCQDMNVDIDEVGSFAVTYLNANLVDKVGAVAGGVLACEFAKACGTGKCRLPSGVTEIVRQGITMTIDTGLFPGMRTRISEVDAYLERWNPYGNRQAPTVYSPDFQPPRRTTA